MKIIKSKNYRYKEINKISEYDPDIWHDKLQSITNFVHQGTDVYEAIRQEFHNLSREQTEKVKDFVLGSLGRPVPIGSPDIGNYNT